jgi:hypothetical protein
MNLLIWAPSRCVEVDLTRDCHDARCGAQGQSPWFVNLFGQGGHNGHTVLPEDTRTRNPGDPRSTVDFALAPRIVYTYQSAEMAIEHTGLPQGSSLSPIRLDTTAAAGMVWLFDTIQRVVALATVGISQMQPSSSPRERWDRHAS